jgi:hypothetical protein
VAIKTFKLKSGATLEIGDIGFEAGVALMEVVGRSIRGAHPDEEVTSIALFDADVRKAVYGCFPWIIYNKVRVDVPFLDSKNFDSRDWYELAGHVIEVAKDRFFYKAPSKSSALEGAHANVPA